MRAVIANNNAPPLRRILQTPIYGTIRFYLGRHNNEIAISYIYEWKFTSTQRLREHYLLRSKEKLVIG